jgi:hypothetical protein
MAASLFDMARIATAPDGQRVAATVQGLQSLANSADPNVRYIEGAAASYLLEAIRAGAFSAPGWLEFLLGIERAYGSEPKPERNLFWGAVGWLHAHRGRVPLDDPPTFDGFEKRFVYNWVPGREVLLPMLREVAATIERAAGQWSDRAATVPGKPATAASKRASGYKPAALAAELKLTTATVNKYAKLAGITTPRRGERDYTYPTADVETLCRYLSTQGGDSSTRKESKRLLQVLAKIAR